jgi:RNA polymerase sigma factor (sigma-70 family)
MKASELQKPTEPAAPASELPGLLCRAQQGDRRAVEELLRLSRPVIAKTARYRLNNPTDVEDVVQEVGLALLQSIDAIHSPQYLHAWLRSVTTRAACAIWRRSNRFVAQETFDDVCSGESTEDAALDGVMREAARHAVTGALEKLRPSERELLKLWSAVETPSYQTISDQVGRPIGSIGPTRKRLLTKLRQEQVITELAS